MIYNIKNKKILVTGGTGQVGSFLVEELVKKKANVFVIGRNKKILKEIDLLVKSKKVTFLECNLINNNEINENKKILKEIDLLIHLSSELSEVNTNLIDNAHFSIDLNINGIINLLPHLIKLKKIIYSSSTAVYGNTKAGKTNEDSITNPVSFYGCGKLGAEKYLNIFCNFNKIPLTILRYSSVYGPRNRTNQVIPVFIKKALENKTIILYKKGKTIRDFIYISDIINATIKAITNNQEGIFNIGSGEKTTMYNIAKKIIKLTNSKSKIIFKESLNEINFVLDAEKAKIKLKFNSKINLDIGLLKEIEWHKKYNIIKK
jgi:UDP-glucose 4-epimerase|tara:strand:+ start:493 stop:1446 length:954 start_codon:yes stop_codon:yes gene_type:complete